MGVGFTDWTDAGIWPLQDHEPQISTSVRRQLAGGRIERAPDTTETDDAFEAQTQYADRNGLGTIGDVHPWLFIQTQGRDVRGTGSWAQSLLGAVTESATGTVGGGGTGLRARPIHDGAYTIDTRYEELDFGWPGCFPRLPESTLVAIMPTTREDQQEVGVLHGDPRLFAPQVSGPADAGSIVCDFQPTGRPCMGDAPGDFEGRTARLQSMMRVIAMPEGGFLLGSGEGNGLAWNLTASQQDGLAGYGMVYARVDGGRAGPTTGGAPPTTPTTGARGDVVARNAGVGNTLGTRRVGLGTDETLCDSGEFSPAPQGGTGIAFMDRAASGPFHAGHADDKHNLGTDRDGNPMNSGHIATNAYFFRNRSEDGPLFFEGAYPYPPPYPLISRVHLTWDPTLAHSFVGGARLGQWRWYAEVPFISPDGQTPPGQRPPTTGTPPGPSTPGPATPSTPTPATPGPGPGNPGGGRPTTPRPRGPTTGGGGGGTTGGGTQTGGEPGGFEPVGPGLPTSGLNFPFEPTRGPTTGPRRLSGIDPNSGAEELRNDVLERAGDDAPPGLYEVFHPYANSFASMAFRPQFVADGQPMATHNPQLPRDLLLEDEARRPAVMRMQPWGSQGEGDWSYLRQPEESISRGGSAAGGVLLTPPDTRLDEYLLGRDVSQGETRHWLAAAEGVGFALGEPLSGGGLAPLAATLARGTAAAKPVTLSQIDTGGTSRDFLSATLVGSGGERIVVAEGTTALGIPRGTTAQRPSTPTGGHIRVATNRVTGSDTPEVYNQQTSSWERISTEDPVSSGVQVSVSNTTSFLTVHTSSVGSGGMGSNGTLTAVLIGDVLINALGNPQIRITWNGTTIQTITHVWMGAISATPVPFYMQVQMGNLNSAATQYLTGHYTIGGETGVVGVDLASFTSADTAAGENDLTIQASWTVASANLVFRKLHSQDRISRR